MIERKSAIDWERVSQLVEFMCETIMRSMMSIPISPMMPLHRPHRLHRLHRQTLLSESSMSLIIRQIQIPITAANTHGARICDNSEFIC